MMRSKWLDLMVTVGKSRGSMNLHEPCTAQARGALVLRSRRASSVCSCFGQLPLLLVLCTLFTSLCSIYLCIPTTASQQPVARMLGRGGERSASKMLIFSVILWCLCWTTYAANLPSVRAGETGEHTVWCSPLRATRVSCDMSEVEVIYLHP